MKGCATWRVPEYDMTSCVVVLLFYFCENSIAPHKIVRGDAVFTKCY